MALVPWLALGCGGEEKEALTYRSNIRPILLQRCTVCHSNGNPIGVNIEDPYNPETGLVTSRNTANVRNPAVATERNVVPFDPENSYLINKLTGDLPADGSAGARMPLQIPPLTDQEKATVETWIRNGAMNDTFYQQQVQPIFGYRERGREGKCVLCHYNGTPNPPDLTPEGVFGPQGVLQRARFRADMQRVQPGDPERSFLVLKVRATQLVSGVGAPMPYSYEALEPAEIEVIQEWIEAGALSD